MDGLSTCFLRFFFFTVSSFATFWSSTTGFRNLSLNRPRPPRSPTSNPSHPCISHGDFSQWNRKICNRTLAVSQKRVAFDVFIVARSTESSTSCLSIIDAFVLTKSVKFNAIVCTYAFWNSYEHIALYNLFFFVVTAYFFMLIYIYIFYLLSSLMWKRPN